MQSTLRRRADADADADRLGDLPDCLLHRILSSLGSRQAVQTSVLSRRGDSRARDTYDRWIRRGLRHFPVAVDIRAASGCTFDWQPHHSYSARQKPDLSFRGSCAAGFTGRLTKLRLVRVKLVHGFLEDLDTHCPALEELHVERYSANVLSVVTSPTLRTLTVVEPRIPMPCPHLRIAAPRLSCLRLEIPYGDRQTCQHCGAGVVEPEPEPLAALVGASIRLTDMNHPWPWEQNQREQRKRKLGFMKSIRSFLALLPNVTILHLTGFTTTALLDEESQEFPVLDSLKTLLLEECDVGLKFQVLKSILWNTPNLENLGLHHCEFTALPGKKKRSKRGRQPSKGGILTRRVFWCKNLKSIEIERPQEDMPVLAEVLSMIFNGMQPGQWRRVKTSITVVQRTE
ncbi:unnamed protein product [Alopecurus aequalis]